MVQKRLETRTTIDLKPVENSNNKNNKYFFFIFGGSIGN
jgi:hypothetical protein